MDVVDLVHWRREPTPTFRTGHQRTIRARKAIDALAVPRVLVADTSVVAGDLARAGRHDRLARDRAISIPTVASAARIPMTVRRREAALRAAQVADARPQFAVANTSTRTLQRFFGTRHGLLHFYGRRARRQG